MNTELIVLVPAILSTWIIFRPSAQRALIAVYLPVLLLVPDYFHLEINGLPDPTLSQCAILPIAVVVCRDCLVKKAWKLSVLDLIVGGYVLWGFVSDWHNADFKDAMNESFDLLTLSLFPYMAGKMLIEPLGMRSACARRFVWLVFIVCVVSIYEFRMEDSLFRPALSRFFPGQESGWVTQVRWGFGRVAGPYGHAILMGGIVAIAVLLHNWLCGADLWEHKFRWLRWLPMSKPKLLLFGLLLGSFMTFSRGPWIGLACGIACASIGTARHPGRRLLLVVAVSAAMGFAIYVAGKAYVDGVDISNSDNAEEQASAAYRAKLIDEYVDIALRQSFWGWGRGRWPRVLGMSSIDNHYLFLSLEQGLVGTGLFVIMLLAIGVRVLQKSLSLSIDAQERAFAATMLGIVVSVGVCITTVFLGTQLYPLLFLFVGWTEGSIVIEPKYEVASRPVMVSSLQFRSVLT